MTRFARLFFVAFVFVTPLALAVTADDLVKQGLEAEKRMDPRAALGLFEQADALRPNDPFILQRISRQYSDATTTSTSAEERRRFSEQALVYSKRAYELEPRNPVYVLSMAICYGKLGLYGDTRLKVDYGRLVKKYAEEALALDPNYNWAHHVLGLWHYEVVELGGAKRFFAKVFFGGLPAASIEEAIAHLRRAVELSPKTPAHHIELGFALQAADRKKEARTEFERGLALPSLEIHDESAKKRAREAMGKGEADPKLGNR